MNKPVPSSACEACRAIYELERLEGPGPFSPASSRGMRSATAMVRHHAELEARGLTSLLMHRDVDQHAVRLAGAGVAVEMHVDIVAKPVVHVHDWGWVPAWVLHVYAWYMDRLALPRYAPVVAIEALGRDPVAMALASNGSEDALRRWLEAFDAREASP